MRRYVAGWYALGLLGVVRLAEYGVAVAQERETLSLRRRLSQDNEETSTVEESVHERELIIGGKIARAGDYPYFVHYATPGCGGVIIAPDVVLTAAHCRLRSVSDYGTIYVGRHDKRNNRDNAETFSVVQQLQHPRFNDQVCCGKAGDEWFYGVHNDFMLLKLSGESSLRPIAVNSSPIRPQRGSNLYVIGFGDTDPGEAYVEPNRLHEVTVNYMTNNDCIKNSIYPSKLINSASLCAADDEEDACAGDSGGPLIQKGRTDAEDVLVGIVSWGWQCATEPGVYARVSSEYNWIRDGVCRMSENPPLYFRCPTSAPAPTPNPTRRPTPQPTERPTESPTQQPTMPPTIRQSTSLEEKAAETNDILVDILDFTPFGRQYLPAGKSCQAASLSPTICCSSRSSHVDSYGEDCIAAPFGSTFEGGLPCESAKWVETNDPKVYQASPVCEMIAQKETDTRRSLPEGDSCDTISNANECCMYYDNRADRGSIHHGQPCVALRTNRGFPQSRGVCEPATLVVNIAPSRAWECADLRQANPDIILDTSNVFDSSIPGKNEDHNAYLQDVIEKVQSEVESDQQQVSVFAGGLGLEKVTLPLGVFCEDVLDPMICCAATEAESGRSCRPEPSSSSTFSTRPKCQVVDDDDTLADEDMLPTFLLDTDITARENSTTSRANDGADENVTDATEWDDIESEAETTTKIHSTNRVQFYSSFLNKDQEVLESSLEAAIGLDYHDYYCERLQTSRRTRLSSSLGCGAITSPRTCCLAKDQDGRPCVPLPRLSRDTSSLPWDNAALSRATNTTMESSAVRTGRQRSRCAPYDWVIANAPQQAMTCQQFHV